jgi:hypothetical protein
MDATHRFLMAPSLLLALGIACVGNRLLLTTGFLLCLCESLFITPAHWPIPSKKAELPEEISMLHKPFVFWPPPPVISSYKVTMTSLLLDQPIALFSAQGSSMPDSNGNILPIHTLKDRHGRTLDSWLKNAVEHDINKLIQYRSFYNSNGNLPFKTHQRKCYSSYCVSLFVHKTPKY